MDLQEFKKEYIDQELGINKSFEPIYSFIDFANVDKWFERDRQNPDRKTLAENQKLAINIEKLKDFASIFSNDIRFYYGHYINDPKSLSFIKAARHIFNRNKILTKPVQKIKHYLSKEELDLNTRNVYNVKEGKFIYIPKCNFDVEISVDSMRLMDNYKTLCLFSGDADFVYLTQFLKNKGKKIILIKGGHIVHQLKEVADIIINAQDIKRNIVMIKQKPDNKSGFADSKLESTSR